MTSDVIMGPVPPGEILDSSPCTRSRSRHPCPWPGRRLGPGSHNASLGAGDENRTRTVSLGSRAVTAAEGADLPISTVRSSRD